MYRAFSTAVRAAKNITWTFNGTTQDINAALSGLQQALDAVPGLADKVENGVIKYVLLVEVLSELASNRC